MSNKKIFKALTELTDFRASTQALFKSHSDLITSVIELHERLSKLQSEGVRIDGFNESFAPTIESLQSSIEALNRYNDAIDKEYMPAMKSLFEMAKVIKSEN